MAITQSFRFEALSNIVSKLDRLYTLDEHILRFLTLKLSKDALEQIDKNKSQSVLTEAEKNTQVGENNTTKSVGSKIEDNDKK